MRIVKPQVVGLSVCILATMEFPQNNGRPVRREPHIEEVNRAVRTDPLSHGGVVDTSIRHVTGLVFGKGCNFD